LQYHGTTTLAFLYKNGIIVAVDSKASVGSYVGSRTVKKVFPISKHILATMAGGAADCAFWIRRTARQAKVLEHEHGSPMKVCSIAKLLAASLREYRGSDLSVGTMVAGYDLQTSLPSCTILTVTPLHSRTNSFCSEGLLLAFRRIIDNSIHNVASSRLNYILQHFRLQCTT
jgi:20S proteasome alpha/beta subunit